MGKFSNGAVVPEDTMSVKLAKAQHFQAKAVEYMKKPYMVAPVVYKAPIAPVAPLAHHTYAPYTYPYAAHHFVKREAEAEPEADAQVLLNTYKAGVLPYAAVHRVFKREAEAEPEADSQFVYNTA